MFKKKAASVALAALAGAALAAAPAYAQPTIGVNLPCEAFADPYDYPCGTAEQTANFVLSEVGDAGTFVGEVRDEVGGVVFTVYCIAFPNQPECP